MLRAVVLACVLPAAGCVSINHPAVPETVSLEAGTSVRHEVGDAAVQVNTVAVKAAWRLRK